jgi:hypothetical protein
MQRLLACALLFALGCASADQRPPDVTPPLIRLIQPGDIFFGNEASTATTIDVEIQNRATVPITVREVAVSSFAMTDYRLIPTTRRVAVVIPPGETRTVGVVATLEAVNARSVSLEPLSVRAVVRMEANGRSFREVVMQRLTGTGS